VRIIIIIAKMKITKKAKKFNSIKIEVAEGKKSLGRVFLYLILNEQRKKNYGILGDLFVNEKYRGQGLGTLLVKKGIAEAKKRKCYKLLATSRFSNRKLHKWYQKFGFKKYGVEFRMEL
jgi:GNAT superfamily N-acetyltransferase